MVVAGLGLGGDNMTGLGLAGLGLGGDNLTGIFAAGLGVGADEFTGVGASLLGAGADHLEGALFTGGYLRAIEAAGLTTGAYNHIKKRMTGLQIGLFNRTDELHGVQIGLINYAGNNPRGLQLMPGVNMHF